MKKFLLPFMLLLTVIMTISSCGTEADGDGDGDGESKSDLLGFYTGTVKTNSDLTIFYGDPANPTVDVDTAFSGVPATAEILDHDSEDSLNLEVKLTIDGTPITIKVPAKVNGNTLTITDYPYTYLIVKMIVNGTATVNGDDVTANITIENDEDGGNPANTIIEGDLTFDGSK